MVSGTGNLITDRAEVLRRQVHPGLLDPTVGVMKTAFTPSDRDCGLLSTLRGSVDAREAHQRWIAIPGHESAGTWGISVGEAADLSLPSLDDGHVPGMPRDHASVDFRKHSKGLRLQLGRKLRESSVKAGPLFVPADL